MKKLSLVSLALLTACTAAAVAQAAPASLTVTVENIGDARGRLMAQVLDESGWAGRAKSVQNIAVPVTAAGAMMITLEKLPPGRYAVRVFHDRDNDGKLARGAFGLPAEPYGFSNNAPIRFGPPKFADAAVAHGAAAQSIRVRLTQTKAQRH
jgi:uncharacterized protein (DUF2141 family)